MNRLMGMLVVVAFFLTSCLSSLEDSSTPAPGAQVTVETAGPTLTNTDQPTPTLTAATATTASTLTPSATHTTTADPTTAIDQPAEPGITAAPDPGEPPIRFDMPAGHSPWRTFGAFLPGQSDRYVFYAEAGQRVVIDLNSASQANFALSGLDDGQPYKRVVNEDRTWQGILPHSQDYMLTIVSAAEAADYELLVASLPSPPFTVIYDAHTDALLGGLKDALWVDANTAASALLGGEQFDIYHLDQRLSQATGSASMPIGGICTGHTVHLAPQPDHPYALAVAGAPWDVAPRPVAPVELSQAERQAVARLMAGQGLTISASDLQVAEALGADLDGNGLGEVIVLASRLKDDGRFPAVAAGNYVVVAVLMEIGGRLHAEPLILNVYSQADDLAYPWGYEVSGVLDLNSDGVLEVILAGARWEGSSTVVYSVGTAGGAASVLERTCAE